MHRSFLIVASLLLGAAVALGAFGAHGLKQLLPGEAINTFETGVRYHFYHAFALLATGIIYERYRNRRVVFAGYCFLFGIVLFCGSLYLLTGIKATSTVGMSGVGIITPFGGLFFIAGWLLLAVGIMSRNTASLKSV